MGVEVELYDYEPCRLVASSLRAAPVLVFRLVAYARQQLKDARLTLEGGPESWSTKVTTLDALAPPSRRVWHVTFIHKSGCSVTVDRIHVNEGGWPWMDQGISVERV